MLLVLLGALIPAAGARVSLEEAFLAVARAEEAGGEVAGLVELLNVAILLMREGETGEAEVVLQAVIRDAEAARLTGLREARIWGAVSLASAALLSVLAFAVWRYGDAWYWRLWLKVKEGHVVE